MGELFDRTKGSVNEAVGRTKQAAGRAARNPRLYMDGVSQVRRGRMQRMIGRLKGIFGWRI